MILTFILLSLVLIPGVGRTVNGSTRWLDFGFIRIQVSEIAKLCIIIYLSRYIVVYQERVRTNIIGFINAMLMVSLVVFLLLCEPDFGASVVLVITSLCLLFLGGVSLWTFTLLVIASLLSFSILAVSSPYRLARLTGFLDPWANQFDSGYQLTQSLIAFGQGGWFGVGLGNSVQKLFYLPEAHTDFIFAVIIEELGLLGGVFVLALYAIFFIRGMQIGKEAHKLKLHFNGYLAQGITVLITVQTLINMGVNTGILPTKGLNLPLISYGGSNLIITYTTLAILFRVSIENKFKF
ncbi:MAG: putative lipid II flippase FtsW [Legionellales bacterium]|nr:putative lipid II flippase FtsW [Legionellales bacterium]